ncbi:MAG: hypothetical protein ACRC0S_03725, partial [Fusobacteriaceae bacterium]
MSICNDIIKRKKFKQFTYSERLKLEALLKIKKTKKVEIAELRLLNVTDIIAANDFLVEYFEQFNKEFSIDFNSIKSVFEKQLTLEEINLHLSILHERII